MIRALPLRKPFPLMASLTFMQLWGPYEKLNFSRQAPMEQGRAGTFHIRQWVDFGVQSLDPVPIFGLGRTCGLVAIFGCAWALDPSPY